MENQPILGEGFTTGSDPRASFSHRTQEDDSQQLRIGEIGYGGGTDRRFAFSRQPSFRQSGAQSPAPIFSNDSSQPMLYRSSSSISIPPGFYQRLEQENVWKEYGKSSFREERNSCEDNSFLSRMFSLIRVLRMGSRPMKRLSVMISLNVAYSTAELIIGLFTGRIGLVSDAFHLTFGCGLLTFSLFAMAVSRKRPDGIYTYGYKRLEVLSAFTNATAVSFVYVILIGCGGASCICAR